MVVFYGCTRPNYVAPPAPTSPLSLVYACTPVLASSIAVIANGKGVFGTNYGSDVEYATGNIPAGNNVQLTFYLANPSQNNVLYSSKYNFVADSNYTLFFGGPAANPCHLFVQNDMSALAAGMAKVRFVILSSYSNQFNCFKGTSKLVSGLSYQSVSAFIEVPADSVASFTFVNADNPAIQVPTGTFLLGSGGICTIVLGGNYGSGNFHLNTKIVSLNAKVIL